jgi:catechol 2,3-dioxygenase-like lactoylglutathione lyase family enzyme
MEISVVSLPVADQERAQAFYTAVLGFTVEAVAPMGPQDRWVMLRPPGGGAAITLVTWFPTMPPGSTKGLVFTVQDIDALHQQLVARGLDLPDGVREEPWGRYVTLDDPDGNGLIFQQPPTAQAAS